MDWVCWGWSQDDIDNQVTRGALYWDIIEGNINKFGSIARVSISICWDIQLEMSNRKLRSGTAKKSLDWKNYVLPRQFVKPEGRIGAHILFVYVCMRADETKILLNIMFYPLLLWQIYLHKDKL